MGIQSCLNSGKREGITKEKDNIFQIIPIVEPITGTFSQLYIPLFICKMMS